MIVEWVCDGAIRDQHEEFFVGCDNTVSDDRLWQDKYNLRHAQIPSFISEQQAKKVNHTYSNVHMYSKIV